MREAFWRWVLGWIEVTFSGGRPSEILTQLAAYGQRLWVVTAAQGRLTVHLSLSGIGSVRRVARMTGARAKFGRRGGLPLVWRGARRRPGIAIGLIAAVGWFAFFSGRVWLVDVPAANLPVADRRAIVAAAAEAGLTLGSPAQPERLERIRLRMQSLLPQFSWIGLERQGVLVTIAVAPFLPPPPPATVPYLVAKKGGEVRRVVVYIGRATVQPGERVRRGQVLIEGVVAFSGQQSEPSAAVRVNAPAAGEVWAAVTYQASAFQPYQATEAELGRRLTVVRWVWPDGQLLWQPPSPAVPFRRYQVEVHTDPIYFRGILLPFERQELVYNEVISRVRRLDVKTATEWARRRALAELQADVPAEAPVLRKQEKVQRQPDGVKVWLEWTVEENIAGPPSKQGAGAGGGTPGAPQRAAAPAGGTG
jgi:sporulation protein YqfD